MRWDRLLGEIEASLLDEAALERDALAADLADEEWSSTSARDLIWGHVGLEVQGVGWIEGEVVRAAGDFLVLATAPGEVVVARSAVLGWRGGTGRAPEPRGVVARLGWSQLVRAVRDDGQDVRVVRLDGSQVTGAVEAVAQDAVRIGPATGVVPAAGASSWVVLAAVATMQVL